LEELDNKLRRRTRQSARDGCFNYFAVLRLIRRTFCSAVTVSIARCVLGTALHCIDRHVFTFLPLAVNCGRFCFWRRQSVVFGRSFIKRFALCYRTAVLFVYLSVYNVACCIVDKRLDGSRCNLARAPSSPQRGTAPNSRPMSVVAKRLDGSRCHLVGR